MHALIPPLHAPRTAAPEIDADLRSPAFECHDLPDAVRLEVFVPGVEASGVEITSRGPDLVVTARKAHPVRTNWRALHLEAVQRDYQLKLRLGHGVDFDGLHAELRDGVLSIVVPKQQTSDNRVTARRVA